MPSLPGKSERQAILPSDARSVLSNAFAFAPKRRLAVRAAPVIWSGRILNDPASPESNHDQGDGDGNHGPEQGVAELGSGLGVGEDAVGVVVDVGGDEAGSEDGQEEHDSDSPALPESSHPLFQS